MSLSPSMSLSPIKNQEEFNKILKEVPHKLRETLKLLVQGYSDKEIVSITGDTPISVRSSNSDIFKRFRVSRKHKGKNCDSKDLLINLFYKYKRDLVFHEVLDDLENISSNFYLEEGIRYFKREGYENAKKAKKMFEQATEGDSADPFAQILLNNTKVYLQKVKPLAIAVVVAYSQNDYHRNATENVLRGVADAQTEFNQSNGKDGQLLEIIIVNDYNKPEVSKVVAKNLSTYGNILGIIGHHSSEGTQAALPIYNQHQIAIISPTSTSSKLSELSASSKLSELSVNNFFRTIGSTKVIANTYTDYLKKALHLDEIIVFYHEKNEYSQTLKEDFEKAFQEQGGQIIKSIPNINDPHLDIKSLFKDIETNSKAKAALVISSIKTNAVALAIARENSKLQPQPLKLLLATSLPEELILEKGGSVLEGAVLVNPCLAEQSDYMKQAEIRWQREINWRVATSYDATQALIEAIRLSKRLTGAEVLNNLAKLNLPVKQTSGFGLNWSDSDHHSNAQRKYCINQVRNREFEKVSLNELIE